MAKIKFTAERGRFKKEIHAALYKSTDIKELLLGDTSVQSAKIYTAKISTTRLLRLHLKC